MAIAWEFATTPVDASKKIGRVVAVCVDDVATTTHTVKSEKADLSTQGKRDKALDALWGKYEAQLAKETEAAALDSAITTFNAAAKINFEGRG